MKKITSLLVLLSAIASLSLTSCASQEEAPDAGTGTPGDTPTEQPETPPAEGQ